MKSIKILSTLVVIASILTACEKNNSEEPNFDSLKDQAYVVGLFSDIYDQVEEASGNIEHNNTNKSFLNNGCATLTVFPIDSGVRPKYLTIDFGPVNCLCNDGKYRRGQILVSQTDFRMNPNALRTISFNAYYVNDNNIDGIKTITNNGFNLSGNMYFSILVVDGTVIKPDSSFILWNSSRTREWVDGINTPFYIWDDEYLISGGSNLVNSNNDSLSVTIINPLDKKIGCQWFRSGTVEFENNTGNQKLLDYGNGLCDSLATVTVNGNVYNIILN